MERGQNIADEQVVSLHRTRRKTNNIIHLSEDIILNILSYIPAEYWEKHIKAVCKAWSAIPRDPFFTKLHLLHSKPCLFIQDTEYPFSAQFIDMNDMKCQEIYTRHSFPGRIWDSSGGMLLIHRKHENYEDLWVANPINMQSLKLPTQSAPESFRPLQGRIARTTNGEYKILGLFVDSNFFTGESIDVQWYVLTVGNNMSWRKIGSLVRDSSMIHRSVSIDGVIYWTRWRDCEVVNNIIAFEVNNNNLETCHYLLFPEKPAEYPSHWRLAKLGSHLCYISWKSNIKMMNLWTLKDMHSRIWSKTCIKVSQDSISRDLNCRTVRMVTFMDEQGILIFVAVCGDYSEVVALNLKTETAKSVLRIPSMFGRTIGLHVNSPLAW